MKNKINSKSLIHCLATAVSFVLSLVLFICANTTSSVMIYQPQEPIGLDRFKKIK